MVARVCVTRGGRGQRARARRNQQGNLMPPEWTGGGGESARIDLDHAVAQADSVGRKLLRKGAGPQPSSSGIRSRAHGPGTFTRDDAPSQADRLVQAQ